MLLLQQCMLLAVKAQFYTGSQMEFGKNRIKYENFFWTFYKYDKYDVFFYEEGKELGNYVSKEADKQIKQVERILDYSLDNRIQFIIYNKQSDFRQSNIGLSSEEQYNTGGVTRIAGSKVILYYEGDHAKLDAQIRSGIAEVIIDQMMYGGSLRDMVKSSTLLTFPDWYVKGLINYISYDWNSNIDNIVKDGVQSNKFKNLNHLEGENAVYAGHAFWKHVANNYGEAVIPNLLYMAKVSRSIDNSALFVLGISIRNLWNECLASYQGKYVTTDTTRKLPQRTPIVLKPKKNRVYENLKISPTGNHALYLTNEMGQTKVWLHDLQKNKAKRILKFGHKIDRINDHSFPVMAWHPNGYIFTYMLERKGFQVMVTYNLQTNKKVERNIIGFEKILSYNYNSDGTRIVMSAVQKGITDLFIFTVSSNAYDQLTKDIYDDLNPSFINNSKEIVFSSNRPHDTLFFDPKRKPEDALSHKDLFVYNNENKTKLLKRITNTPGVNEMYPVAYDSSHIAYLSDLNGINNRYIASFDSVIAYVDTAAHYKTKVTTYPVTNYSRNIIEQDIRGNKFAEVIYLDGQYKMYVSALTKVDALPKLNLKNTSYKEYIEKKEKRKKQEEEDRLKAMNALPKITDLKIISPAKDSLTKKDSSKININDYQFTNDAPRNTKIDVFANKNASQGGDSLNNSLNEKNQEFKLDRQRNYETNFSVDNVVSQLDNSFLNASYQRFTGGGNPIYLNPGLNALFKIGISDLFEDYRIVGGARFSGDFNNNEYFVSWENRMKNIDKQLILHRQSLLNASNIYEVKKIHTNEVKRVWKYPLSEVLSIRGSLGYRNDRIIYVSISDQLLKRPHDYEHYGNSKLEMVFDNTIKKGLNLYNGIRAKIFGEYYRQLNKKNTDFFVIGTDFRHYQKIHRDFIWANRFAASTSFGSEKLIYYMGGVDNWFNPKFDKTTNIATNQHYAYQTIATNMRGFRQNIRNGNSFAVVNSELRFPVFKYFFKRPIRSDFIYNFQVVGFGDVGTAWTGYSPYAESNSLNTTVIGNNQTPYLITLKTQHDPFVFGYGYGFRTRIFGYFIRFDKAWGLQDGVIGKPIWHISLSLDF